MGIWQGVKRASKALVSGPTSAKYFAGGKQVVCDHCEHPDFYEGKAQLNTAGMTFLGLDWANESVTTLMCESCGRIHWFGMKPDRR